jgi:hypothetical protein
MPEVVPMQCEGNSARLALDVEIERLCEALVNAAADWWARGAAEEDAIASGSRKMRGLKRTRVSSGPSGQRSSRATSAFTPELRAAGWL